VDLPLGHPIHGLRGGGRGYRTRGAGEPTVGVEVEVSVEQLAIDVFQWQSSSAAIADDSQDSFGSSHPEYLTALVVRTPAPLRQVDGFPVRGLLWGLRPHGARAL